MLRAARSVEISIISDYYQVKDNAALVIVGETGSGKTTQLPQYLLHAGYSPIAVTQVSSQDYIQIYIIHAIERSFYVFSCLITHAAAARGRHIRCAACCGGAGMRMRTGSDTNHAYFIHIPFIFLNLLL